MSQRIGLQRDKRLAVVVGLFALAVLLGGCAKVLLGLHPPAWIHGTWGVAVVAGDQIIETELGFEFTATTAHMFMPQVRFDLGEMYRRAGSGGEVITDTLYSFTIKAQAGAFGYSEGDYVTYEFRRVTSTRVDMTIRTPLLEIGMYRLHKR